MDYTTEFMAGFACSPPPYLPQELAQRLKFLSCLAHRQQREVYLVLDAVANAKAILKITEPQSADSVAREYELLSKLEHPSIPQALLYHQDSEGREYLLREYIPGDTLDFLLERDGVFEPHLALSTVKKVCEVLSYLHRQNPPIIYRDVKPQNVIVTPNGKVSLIDFGISKEENKDKHFDTICVGSTGFAAPELYGFTKADSRTDIFALGRLLLYLSTGIANQQEAIGKVNSPVLRRIINKCTELAPNKRFASVEKLSRAINRVLYPPTGKEIAAAIGGAIVCLVLGLYAFSHWNASSPALPDNLPVSAGGGGYEQQVKLPVSFQTLWQGQPFADCAVAIDNHYWYAPTEQGKAELYAFAYDQYRVRAVTGNRTASVLTAVTKDTMPLSFTFDLAETPQAPAYLPLTLPFGQAQEVALDITGADSINLLNYPEGVAIEQRGEEFYLVVSGNITEPGHYYVFAEAQNEQGKADMIISLYLEEEQQITEIKTAAQLEQIRANLSGHYVLAGDIDLSALESWTPIGSYETPFTGVLDGQGHSISGLAIQGKQSMEFGDGGLFGVINRGVVSNVNIRGGDLYTAYIGTVGYGFIVGRNIGGLIENCAVWGGKISANLGLESGVGGICGINFGIVRNCFNSADITIFTLGSKNWTESCAGGLIGTNSGYLADSGNTGAVSGISLAGGVAGFNDGGFLTRCYNAGYVQSTAYFASYLPGGICHLLGAGYIASYSAFEEGTAQVGASVFNGGTLLGLSPLPQPAFRNLNTLSKVFHVEPAANRFAYASLDSYYPIPAAIFTRQAAAPSLPQSGHNLRLDAQPQTLYFYTTDGSDPHEAGVEGVESLDLSLQAGQTIKIFAAQAGCLDSETVEYTIR